LNQKKFLRVLLFIIIDFISIYVIACVAYFTRLFIGNVGWLKPLTTDYWEYYALHSIWMAASLALFAMYEGLYTKRHIFIEEARTIVRMVSLWGLMIIVVLALSKEMANFSRIIMLTIYLLSLVFIPLVHYFGKRFLIHFGFYSSPMLILGAGEAGIATAKGIIAHPYLGYDLVGFLDDDPHKSNQMLTVGNSHLPIYGTLNKMEEVIKDLNIRSVAVAMPSLPTDKLTEIINRVHHLVRRIMVIPNVKGVSLTNTELHYLFDQQMFMLKLSNNLDSYSNSLIKRIFDIVVSILMLPVLLPLIGIIGIMIKFESPGPVLFTHDRVGKNGYTVPILKFRSMFRDSKERLEKILANDSEAKAEWETNFKLKNDPRVTKVGAFLRKTSLDELPQIFNVLIGQMSLVGPRPVVQEEIDKYYGDDADYYHMVLPGITGLWQVNGRSETSYEYRVGIDTWYVLNWSLWLDIVILFKTVKVVLKRDGAY
jgi:Undecaprenyl-phosphate galactose phosphotransferase WbaP